MPRYSDSVERWPEFGGRIEYDAKPVQRSIANVYAAHEERVKINTERAYERGLDRLMRDLQEQDLDELARRVSREIRLEEDIQGFEKFLLSFGHRRIYM